MASTEAVKRITARVAAAYPSFGGGKLAGAEFNPLIAWTVDQPAMFAAGVRIDEVVASVLAETGYDDLLEACRWFVHLAHNVGRSGGSPEPDELAAATKAGMAAIAKAEGAA